MSPVPAAREAVTELTARERATAILDPGSARELLDPFALLHSPHLAVQGITPQSDDGAVVVRGTLDGAPAVVLALDGDFQGGGIGEVCGAKLAGALELALADAEAGTPTRPVLLLETGGIRLQEANLGLLAIAEIHAAISALRRHVPVVAVVTGRIGCFGGMGIAAGLCSDVIMTTEGRLSLNGPEVIEQEAGVAELDASDRAGIWRYAGGRARVGAGLADVLVADDAGAVRDAVRAVFDRGPRPADECRSTQVDRFTAQLAAATQAAAPQAAAPQAAAPQAAAPQAAAPQAAAPGAPARATGDAAPGGSDGTPGSRGAAWFTALTGGALTGGAAGPVASVLVGDIELAGRPARVLATRPDPTHRWPRARRGELGLDEGWALAAAVREVIAADATGPTRRPIVAVVDSPSQAYGHAEELLGIHQSLAAAVDAYAAARRAGHPVLALVVGNAISGAFLAHGLQANRLVVLDDGAVTVQAMSKESTARVTRRTVAELDEIARQVPATAYDGASFATLGAVHRLLAVQDADAPTAADVDAARAALADAARDAEAGPTDLSVRLGPTAAAGRAASIEVRHQLAAHWQQ